MKYVVVSQGLVYSIPDKFISKYNLKPGNRTPFTKLLIINDRCLECCNEECEITRRYYV